MPLVSVVIPTHNRAQILLRSIHSVLAQTYRQLEIVVVIDGEDPLTTAALADIRDDRLRWIEITDSVGGAEARNIGIRSATGNWLALLDDDDEWLPTKIEEQMNEARTAPHNCLIVTRFIDKRSKADIVQPGCCPRPGQPISEYLFCETSPLGFRNGFLQTSTWLAPRQIFLEVPFSKGLPRNQDTDWLLRAVGCLNLNISVVWKILAIFHNEQSAGRITSTSNWRDTVNWALSPGLFTPKALFFFFATVTIPAARLTGEPMSVFWRQLRVARQFGRPTLKSAWLFVASWFVFPYGRFGFRCKLQHFLNLRAQSERPA
jgi:glycosyltransferase involved in cell wall biosynthesis